MWALADGIEVVSVGGPTETTLWNIWYPIGEVDPAWSSIPYGKPIANTRYYVLNEVLEECPIWVPGELCCAGVGVARGYWRDDAKTQAKFVRHPVTGERLYRTGDVGCYLPDGNIEFIGRRDFQVSIRGQRIEPGEIEAALTQHDAVHTAVVIADGERHDQRLLAYLVPVAGHAVTPADLRDFAKTKLPEHMVPTGFVLLDRLPLGPTGKVDRRALPTPETYALPREAHGDTLLPDVEQALLSVVQEVLARPEVGVETNLFELGANSIHLVQIHVKLKENLDIDIPIVDMFQHPTIRHLARSLRRDLTSQLVPHQVQPRGRQRTADSESIAIIGMSCHFPGATTPEAFWQNLAAGSESITFFSDGDLLSMGVDPDLLQRADFVGAEAVLEHIDSLMLLFSALAPRKRRLSIHNSGFLWKPCGPRWNTRATRLVQQEPKLVCTLLVFAPLTHQYCEFRAEHIQRHLTPAAA